MRVWDCNSLTNDHTKQVISSSAAIMYGHEARIWKVDSFVKGMNGFLFSFSNFVVWSFYGHRKTFSVSDEQNFAHPFCSSVLVFWLFMYHKHCSQLPML